MKRHKRSYLLFEFAILVLAIGALGPAQLPVLAQHGGGHGGGGGHSSGFGGGGAHAAGFGGSRPAASHPNSHPASSSSRTPVNAARIPSHDSLPPGMVGALNRAASSQSGKGNAEFAGPPEHTTIGFPPIAGSATTFPTAPVRSGPLSFSGEGHQIWQNAAPSASSGASATARPPAGMVRPVPPHIIHQPPSGYGPGVYYPFYGLYGFYPLFGFGYGYGFGLGCDPLDPTMFGCPGYGYGYGPGYWNGPDNDNGYGPESGYGVYGQYPPALDNGEPPSTNGLEPNSPDDNSGDNSNVPYDVNAHNSWQNPPDADTAVAQTKPAAPHSVLYLRDGTNFEVGDYWVADGKLHYVTNYGGENSVDLGQVDIQRSVDANASRGLNFSLHPATPTPLTPPPSTDNARPAQQQQ